MASNSIFPKKILKLRRLFPSFAFLLDSCLVPTHHGHPKWYLTLMNTLIETKWKLEQHEDFVWETSRQSRKREMLFEEYFKLHHFWIETKFKKKRPSHILKRSSGASEVNPAFPFSEWREAYRKQSVKVHSKRRRKQHQHRCSYKMAIL